ncbi:unnamed protein product, partial [Chrysoparadoxa australica]
MAGSTFLLHLLSVFFVAHQQSVAGVGGQQPRGQHPPNLVAMHQQQRGLFQQQKPWFKSKGSTLDAAMDQGLQSTCLSSCSYLHTNGTFPGGSCNAALVTTCGACAAAGFHKDASQVLAADDCAICPSGYEIEPQRADCTGFCVPEGTASPTLEAKINAGACTPRCPGGNYELLLTDACPTVAEMPELPLPSEAPAYPNVGGQVNLPLGPAQVTLTTVIAGESIATFNEAKTRAFLSALTALTGFSAFTKGITNFEGPPPGAGRRLQQQILQPHLRHDYSLNGMADDEEAEAVAKDIIQASSDGFLILEYRNQLELVGTSSEATAFATMFPKE